MNSESLGLLQQGLFYGFFISLAAALASLALYPLAQRRLKNLDPRTQSTLVLAWCVLPVLAAFTFVFLALLPSLLPVLGLNTDHCLGHPEGHIHFCLIHRHELVDTWEVWLPVFLFAGLLVAMALHLLMDLAETARFKKALLQFPHSRQADFHALQSATPLALTCGLFRQEIFISTGLLEVLSQAEREMIVAHEQAHRERHDALKRLFARALSLGHIPIVRKHLLDHLNLASELACDRSSSRIAGDPGKVAALLLKVERLYKRHFTPSPSLSARLLGDGVSTLPHRINSLLDSKPLTPPLALLPICVVICLSLLLGHDAIHDFLEHFMTLVAGNP